MDDDLIVFLEQELGLQLTCVSYPLGQPLLRDVYLGPEHIEGKDGGSHWQHNRRLEAAVTQEMERLGYDLIINVWE